MSSIVYFKFKANVKTDSVSFDGSSISVRDLKSAIRTKCCLFSTDFELKLEDTTGKVYVNDDELIPKYSNIVVRRIPRIVLESNKKKPVGVDDLSYRNIQKNVLVSEIQSNKPINLANSDLSEEEKIKIMMERSSEAYCESNYVVKAKPYGVPPSTYICHKCNLPGHWIHNCPGVRDKTGKLMDVKSIKRPTGIPQDFLLEVEAGTPGAYLGKSGRYMVPIKDAEAYAQGKKDKRPFSMEENPPYVPQKRQPPKQFTCSLCGELFVDAVLVSCCGTTYCNDCIMGHAFDSQVLGSHKCPNCNAALTDHESNVFENALVRSLIRDWLVDETKVLDNLLNEDEMKKGEVEKLNYRRVLKPRQALENSDFTNKEPPNVNETVEDSNSGLTQCSEVKAENGYAQLSVSKTNSVTLTTTVSSKNDSVSVFKMNVSNNTVCAHNTISDVVTSFPCATLVEVNRPVLSTMGFSNIHVPDISHVNTNSVIPAVLQGISGGNSSLLNVLYNMQLGNLQAPISNAPNALSVAYSGSLVGAPEWITDSVLNVSAQGPSLVNPVLQVNDQIAYGLVPGNIGSGLMAPIETLDGHKMLSKEEFYRLKMEVLHSSRRRHRHRSQSRSPVMFNRSSRSNIDSIRHRYGLDRRSDKRSHHPSSRDKYSFKKYQEDYHSYAEKYDRIRAHRVYEGLDEHRRRHVRHSRERSPHMDNSFCGAGRSLSPSPHERKVSSRKYAADRETDLKCDCTTSLPKECSPIYSNSRYYRSDSDSVGLNVVGARNPSVPKDVTESKDKFQCHSYLQDHLNSPSAYDKSDENWNLQSSNYFQSSDRRIVLTRELSEIVCSPVQDDLQCAVKVKNKKEKKHRKHKHKRSDRKSKKNKELISISSDESWIFADAAHLKDHQMKQKKVKKHKKHKHGDKKTTDTNDFVALETNLGSDHYSHDNLCD